MPILINTFNEFVVELAKYQGAASWRAGQRALNFLTIIRPDIADLLRGSDFDPFYDDARLPDFYDFVCRHWDE